jgi:hypothetical protein
MREDREIFAGDNHMEDAIVVKNKIPDGPALVVPQREGK